MICPCGRVFYQWLTTQTKCPKCQLLKTDARRSKRASKSQEDARPDKTEARTQIVEQAQPKKAKRPNKRKDRKRLIEELDKVFSLFVRHKNIDSTGHAHCFTCGKIDLPKNLQNGHYHSRRHMSLRWAEENCECQCVACNIFKEGNKPEYTRKIEQKYGKERLEWLDRKKNNLWTPTEFDLRTLIGIYKEKLKEIENKHKLT